MGKKGRKPGEASIRQSNQQFRNLFPTLTSRAMLFGLSEYIVEICDIQGNGREGPNACKEFVHASNIIEITNILDRNIARRSRILASAVPTPSTRPRWDDTAGISDKIRSLSCRLRQLQDHDLEKAFETPSALPLLRRGGESV